ncbi:MAG: glycosyltransferase [Prevotellaceae bacterium]|jgi:glycosyltransferase involved in cell wall biosynthesis|nr:glycosyltransferase [Prevotellaceae bacterium]
MKIAYILPSLVNKGPIIVAQNLANELCARGHHVDVYYFDEKYGAHFNCPTKKLDKKRMPDFDTYDIVHSHMYRPDKLLSKIKRSFIHAKAVSTIHAHIEKDLAYSYNKLVSFIFSLLWIRYLKKMDMVVAISHFIEKTYIHKFKCISTVYNGVDVDINTKCAENKIIEKLTQINNLYKIIGSYASLSFGKGLHQVINILPEKKDWAMVIIGEGREKANLKKLAAKNNVSDRVLFFPYLINPYNYLPLFDIYAMPSYSEGFGLALVEAALAKVPVVCSDIAIFRELFSEEEVAFFTLDDMTSLSNAIDAACANRKRLAENAYKKATSDYTIHAMVDGYLHLYKRILNDNSINRNIQLS